MVEISVIIPSYKPQDYIIKCIDSLLLQTFENYEIIVVLNGEKEPYFSILKSKYEGKIKLFYNAENNVSEARNLGIKEALGKYLVFIDDDDWVSHNFLLRLNDKKEEDAIICSKTLCYNLEKNIVKDYLGKHFEKAKHKREMDLFFHRKQLSNSCGKLFLKKNIKVMYNKKYKNGEDALFMAFLSQNIKKIKYAKEDCIYYRRIRKSSASRKRKQMKEILINKGNLVQEYVRLLLKKNTKKLFIVSRIIATLKK